MKYLFHPEAEAEFAQAVEYYEEYEDDIQRCLVRRFPYGILYSEKNEEIFIVAIMHLHRDPDYWKHRK